GRLDNYATAVKNQLSFNKMVENQLQQLINMGPAANQGSIPGQPIDGLETVNLVDIFNASTFWSDQPKGSWNDPSLPVKKGDPGRPVIPIS
ncbi:hypothetical protein, partial [Pseudomonas helleri]|uniref:hypothetical protein n=1 Tax=Pseudomonas helleri TaxID=1608996 RepID=UPI001E560ED7